VEEIILIDELDEEIGAADKLEAHTGSGLLHRAFSIVLFGPDGRMLLQQRATSKYHFGGLWTNACCGHPRPGEELVEAARRRLREELGFDTELQPVFSFRYSATDGDSGLTEQELDHVLVGRTSGGFRPDPDEIDDLRWIDCRALTRDVRTHPERYTPWFTMLLVQLPELEAANSALPPSGVQSTHSPEGFLSRTTGRL
jgi:isopentenyl-diphosphate delta-isomerase